VQSQNERDDAQQDISSKERHLQTKRQDLSSIQVTESSLQLEVDSLKRENSTSATSVDNKRTQRKMANQGLKETKERAGALVDQLEDAKHRLSEEKLGTTSTERVAESTEKELAAREKQYQQAEKNISTLKKKMYKDSQRLAAFRKQEADLISDIHGAQANIKNFSTKIAELETKKSRQQELLYNANFQLQHMEKKVSRGLGVRSNEEQEKLASRIVELEVELDTEKQKKALLLQQQRKLQAELRAWNKKYELSDAKYNETMQRVDDVGLEINSCEISLKEMVAKREETMVSHDVTLLDVRRLRDSLRNLLGEVHLLIQQDTEATYSMQEMKEEVLSRNEIKSAQLRTSKEERHKAAIDLGRMKVSLEKIKSKHDMISLVNAGKGEGEGVESPELKLILAAQKREELQQEGDKLDETIQKKEKEIRTMKKTLVQLRERNTNFRSSFSKADMNGTKARELKVLEAKAQEAEESLFKVRKELQELQKAGNEEKARLDELTTQLDIHEEKKDKLLVAKNQFQSDVDKTKSTLDEYKAKVSDYRTKINQNQAGQELQLRKFRAELIQLQSDRICQLLVSLGREFPELREDIMTELDKGGLVVRIS
jgi:chromosome segregation ATPase